MSRNLVQYFTNNFTNIRAHQNRMSNPSCIVFESVVRVNWLFPTPGHIQMQEKHIWFNGKTMINFKCFAPRSVFSLASAPVLRYTILVGFFKSLQQSSLPCYHPDNRMITGGCTGSGIGMPQRTRAITWNRTHINYTECVKSERVGMIIELKHLLFEAFQTCDVWINKAEPNS